MGVTGLLPLLRPLTTESHVKGLRNKTVGIDAYCWLHKAVHCCAAELCQGIPSDKWKIFVLSRIDLLIREGVYVYLVFDGARLPMKAEKEAERAKNRAHHLNEGKQSLRLGDQKKAHSHFSRACDVSPAMAAELIAFVRQYRSEVQVLVAPYEADAQLGYLCREGIVDVAMSEDSDLLLFGCQRVFFKLEKGGRGELVELSDVFQCRNDELDMRECGPEDFLLTCVLSGCDYLPSIPGVGLKQARQTVREHKGQLDRILRALRLRYKEKFPKNYPGTPFEPELASKIAEGLIDPISGMSFEGSEAMKNINEPVKWSVQKRPRSADFVSKPPRVAQQKTLSNFWGGNVEKANGKHQKRTKSAPGQMRLGWCRTSSPAHRRHSEPYSSPIKLPALSPRSFYAAGQMKTPPSPHCHENNGAKEPRDDDVVTAVKKCDFRLALNDESAVDKRSDGTTTTSNLFEKSSEQRGNNESMGKLKSLTKHRKTLGARSRPLHRLSFPLHGNQCSNNQIRAANNKILPPTRHHPPQLSTVSILTTETRTSSHDNGNSLLIRSSSPSPFEHFSFKRDETAGYTASKPISSNTATIQLEVIPPSYSSKLVDQPPTGPGLHSTVESSTYQNTKKYSRCPQPITTPIIQNDAPSNMFTRFARGHTPGLPAIPVPDVPARRNSSSTFQPDFDAMLNVKQQPVQ